MQQQQSLVAHENHLLATFTEVKQLISLSSGKWTESDKNKSMGFVNHVRDIDNLGLKATRGEGVLQFPIATVRETLQDMNKLTTYNKQIKSLEKLTTTPQGFFISYAVLSPPMGDDRDNLMIQGVFEENGVEYLVGAAIVDDNIKPEVKGKVRSTHHFMVYQLTPVSANQTQIVFISCLDPKGSFPGFIKDKMNNSRGLETIEKLNNFLSK